MIPIGRFQAAYGAKKPVFRAFPKVVANPGLDIDLACLCLYNHFMDEEQTREESREEKLLKDLVELSREFGDSRFVRGGGGNTSAKNDLTIWIKPSGIPLAEVSRKSFVAVDRSLLEDKLRSPAPGNNHQTDPVQTIMEQSTRPGSLGRPSIETPIHSLLPQHYVVRTHPVVVDAMTCSREGAQACHRLFPDALWVTYSGLGLTQCEKVRRDIFEWERMRGSMPDVIFMQNHGMFVAADSMEGIRRIITAIFERLESVFWRKGIPRDLVVGPDPGPEDIGRVYDVILDTIHDGEASTLLASGAFPLSDSPLTPDQIVYAKAFLLRGEPTAAKLRTFKDRYGYWPRLIAANNVVFAMGPTHRAAISALDMARHSALVEQYAAAFGGVRTLNPQEVSSLEKWAETNYRPRT